MHKVAGSKVMLRLYAIIIAIVVIGAASSNGSNLDSSASSTNNSYDSSALSQEWQDGNFTISGTVFNDLSGNGIIDEKEPGLFGWIVRLLCDGEVILNTVTDEDGIYSFDNLRPESYSVVERLIKGWNQTAPGGGAYLVTLTDKDAYNLDFGNIEGSVPPREEYPIMYFSPEELEKFRQYYETAPLATIDPLIAAELEESYGQSFSLLNYLTYTASERNQGSCGNCWVWAGTGVMGVDLAVQKGIYDRLSIQYFSSNYNNGVANSWACCGGLLYIFTSFYASEKKTIPWSNSNAHWQDGGRTCSMSTGVSASSISTSPDYPLSTIQDVTISTHTGKEAAISNIKNILHQNKAVQFGFYYPSTTTWDTFQNFWRYQSESYVFQMDFACGQTWSSGAGGHAVLCVGYDDTDPNNEYWIMLNSWGTTSARPNGLFRVDMDMNYDCYYSGGPYAFAWETLNIGYPTENQAPNTPSTPSGPSTGNTGTSYSYSTSATDPDGNQVKYTFDWGDSTTSETGFVNSGTSSSKSHAWSSAGTYSIKAKATDTHGASSGWSSAKQVIISGGTTADILLVDDDNGESYETYYENALSANGYSYTKIVGPPTLSQLNAFNAVIWFTGDDWTTTLTSSDQVNLAAYLDGGGYLFLTGQDIGYDIGSSSFYQNYLHADFVQDDTNIYTLVGVSDDPISGGMTIGISGWGGAYNQYWPSEISPINGASAVFNYLYDGCGAIRVNTGTYNVVYFAFGFEAINDATDRNVIMARILKKPPTVTNSVATSVTASSARLNGAITNTGGENPLVYVYWGDNNGETTKSAWDHVESLGTKVVGTFYRDISSLSPSTQYYYRCYANNSGGEDWADSSEPFTTPCATPAVTNSGGATLVNSSFARLNGEITNTGGEDPKVYIFWGDNDGGTTEGAWDNAEYLGLKGVDTFYADIADLTRRTAYYYRCFANNSGGGSFASSSEPFTTECEAPTVTNADGAGDIGTNSARLNGAITDSGGESPTIYVYWGDNDGGEEAGSWDYSMNVGTLGIG